MTQVILGEGTAAILTGPETHLRSLLILIVAATDQQSPEALGQWTHMLQTLLSEGGLLPPKILATLTPHQVTTLLAWAISGINHALSTPHE